MGIRIWDKLMLRSSAEPTGASAMMPRSGAKMPRIEPVITGAAAMRPMSLKDASNSRRRMKEHAALYVTEVGAREYIEDAEAKFRNFCIIKKDNYSDASRLKTALKILGYEVKTTISRESGNEVHVSW